MPTTGDTIRSGAAGASGAVAASPTGQAVGFNQTAFIFGVVAVAFLIYVTIKGDLAKWLGLLGLAQSTPATATNQTSSTPGTNTLGSALPDVLSGNYGQGNVVPFPTLPTIGSSGASGENAFGMPAPSLSGSSLTGGGNSGASDVAVMNLLGF